MICGMACGKKPEALIVPDHTARAAPPRSRIAGRKTPEVLIGIAVHGQGENNLIRLD
jgi:hypothetical protein